MLDTTVELPNTNDGFEEKLSRTAHYSSRVTHNGNASIRLSLDDSNVLRPVNNIDTPIHGPLLLSNQCSRTCARCLPLFAKQSISVEYPYAMPQRLETIPSCSADSPDTATTFTKQMELTVNKPANDHGTNRREN